MQGLNTLFSFPWCCWLRSNEETTQWAFGLCSSWGFLKPAWRGTILKHALVGLLSPQPWCNWEPHQDIYMENTGSATTGKMPFHQRAALGAGLGPMPTHVGSYITAIVLVKKPTAFPAFVLAHLCWVFSKFKSISACVPLPGIPVSNRSEWALVCLKVDGSLSTNLLIRQK